MKTQTCLTYEPPPLVLPMTASITIGFNPPEMHLISRWKNAAKNEHGIASSKPADQLQRRLLDLTIVAQIFGRVPKIIHPDPVGTLMLEH
jgi:hypothetical protein